MIEKSLDQARVFIIHIVRVILKIMADWRKFKFKKENRIVRLVALTEKDQRQVIINAMLSKLYLTKVDLDYYEMWFYYIAHI